MSLSKILTVFIISCCFLMPDASAQLLWKISGKGLKKDSYLFGTMHVSDSRVFDFCEGFIPAFKSCETFAGELVFDETTLFKMMPLMFMKNDTTLSDLLSEEKYRTVKAYAEKSLGPFASFTERMQPVIISMLLNETEAQNTPDSLLTKNTDSTAFQTGLPLDLYLQDLARTNDMKVKGLETFEEQMNALAGPGLKEQAEMLYNDIVSKTDKGERESLSEQTEKLIRLYTSQDLEGMYTYSVTNTDDALIKRLLTDRNLRMFKRMQVMMQEESVFVGVGAAHLPGSEGLLELLRNAGYTLKAVW